MPAGGLRRAGPGGGLCGLRGHDLDMESIITKGGDSKPYCTICRSHLPSDSPKAVKQHLKSKPHKDAQKQPLGEQENNCAPSSEPSVREIAEEMMKNDLKEDETCELCRMNGRTRTRHSPESYARALEQGEDVEPCLPPPFVRSPKALFPRCRTPFMSLERFVSFDRSVSIFLLLPEATL